MPRRKVFSIVTITRSDGDDLIKAVNIESGFSDDEARALLACQSPGIERHLFAGNELEWSPSVRIGAPRKRKEPAAKPQGEKSNRTPRTRASAGTKFTEDGAKAPEQKQGETNGA